MAKKSSAKKVGSSKRGGGAQRALAPVPDQTPLSDQEATAKAAAVASLRQPLFSEGLSAAERVFGIFDTYAPLGYMLPFEALGYIEILARYNPDYSQAVDNTKTLANSGHDLFVTHSSENKGEKLKSRLLEKARTIQARHGGIDGLINKLLDQAVIYGAMCGEWVLDENMTDVIDFIDVNPKYIRFFWEEEGNIWNPYPHWAPYQQVSAKQADEAKKEGQKVRGHNCVQLNELTFEYFAFDAAPGSPYGTPPFLASLQPISVQRDMTENLAKIVKKVGLLSIIDVQIQSLTKQHNETEDQFVTRAKNYLTEYGAAIESMITEGGIAHFDDAEVNLTSISGNAAGASAIFKQNEEMVFSGLKSMPSVQGRSYSTTETYAGVAYDIIIRNTFKYQRAIKRLIEKGYWMMATVWGENPESIKLEFHSNKSLHRLQDAQARLLEIKIALMLWAAGILNQKGFAQELGYSTVADEHDEIPDSQILGNTSPGGGAGNTSTDDQIQPPTRTDEAATLSAGLKRELMAELAEIRESVESLVIPAAV